ncbi:MAG: hypothetical protein K9J42_13385 [Sulfuritalea sp.]|nr:hypothetical protein [Sulfuritalea sp.]
MTDQTILTSDEAWEEGVLGTDEKFVRVADPALVEAIDAAAGTQMISVRMQQSMIDDLKAIAVMNGGMGYQTLMKQALQRFIDCEKRQLWNEFVREKVKQQGRATDEVKQPRVTPSKRKSVARKAA